MAEWSWWWVLAPIWALFAVLRWTPREREVLANLGQLSMDHKALRAAVQAWIDASHHYEATLAKRESGEAGEWDVGNAKAAQDGARAMARAAMEDGGDG